MKLTLEERVEILKQADALSSDGCSKVSELYQICCFEHDIVYQTGFDFRGMTVSKRQADRRFRQCMQEESKLGKWNPIAWIRWFAVAVFNWNGGIWGKES